ncbi:MAG TPA: hypothetical protein VFQ61_00885, partial [Polyangiaceae bacterium]|nr:hypothetical protein [Polyangiaceae bacterium]
TGLLSIRTLMRPAPRLEAVWPLSIALHKLVQTGESVGVVMDGDHPLGLLEHAQVLSKLAQTPRVDWPKASASARNEREFSSSESPHAS